MNLWLIFLSCIYAAVSLEHDDPVVQLWKKQGKIRGHILKSGNGRDYYAFQEIPYATPPIGQNRFKEPEEHVDWNGVLNTTVNRRVCMQNNAVALTPVPDTMEITEDCLYLNVYTPVKPGSKDKTLPVLFWIHAGGYFYGSGAYQYYDPKYFIDYNIVVVTMNYRLGPFGFLTTADEVIPGNLGLKDQVLAFEWVIQNIHLFGGDPKTITVMGESAGSTSAGYFHLSRRLKGLVRGFILESGSPLSPLASQDDPRHFAFKMGRVLDPNFNSNDSKDLLDILLRTPASDILTADVPNDRYSANIIGSIGIWVPIIENKSCSKAIVTVPMHESLLLGDFNRVPLMTGFSSEESRFFLRGAPEQLGSLGSIYDKNISLIIHPRLNVAPEYLEIASTEYKSIYTTTSFQTDPGAYLKYLSEETFTTPNIRHAELASKFSPVFVYQFSYKGKMGGLTNLLPITGADIVGHTEELKYIFGGAEGSSGDPEDYPKSDQHIMKRMLTLWTNFIKYQNPTPKHDDLLDNIIWPLVEPGKIQYLNINGTLEIRSNPKHYDEVKKVFENYIKPPLVVF
uniref:Carboxylic ester hydrolase n=1 Tax=Leptinotarsa decemlineata TaxID=7539 RepID=A0A0A7EP35_LEPDE|nr:esterase [Leptinotarsa decemlineata]